MMDLYVQRPLASSIYTALVTGKRSDN